MHRKFFHHRLLINTISNWNGMGILMKAPNGWRLRSTLWVCPFGVLVGGTREHRFDGIGLSQENCLKTRRLPPASPWRRGDIGCTLCWADLQYGQRLPFAGTSSSRRQAFQKYWPVLYGMRTTLSELISNMYCSNRHRFYLIPHFQYFLHDPVVISYPSCHRLLVRFGE